MAIDSEAVLHQARIAMRGLGFTMVEKARKVAQVREYHALCAESHDLADAQHSFIQEQNTLRLLDDERALTMPAYVEHLALMLQERDALDVQRSRRYAALRSAGIDPSDFVGKLERDAREENEVIAC